MSSLIEFASALLSDAQKMPWLEPLEQTLR